DGQGIRIAPIKSPFGDYILRIRTRYEELPNIATPVPRELWIETEGNAPSLDVAIHFSRSLAEEFLTYLSVASNAWYGLLTVHLAYPIGDMRERSFFQNWVVDERGVPRLARTV